MESDNNIIKLLCQDAMLEIAQSATSGYTCVVDPQPPIITHTWIIIKICCPETGQSLACRLRKDQTSPHVYFMGVQPLEYIARELPNFPAPRLHSFWDWSPQSSERKSPTGVVYMLVDWIEGKPLEPFSLSNPSTPQRRKVLDQLVEILLDMIGQEASKTAFYYDVPDGTPDGCSVSTTDWLTFSVDRGIKRAFNNNQLSNAIDYLIQRSMVSKYVVLEYDKFPWVFCHQDLRAGNIIIDDAYNIRGIIDWDLAWAMPLQKACTFPPLLLQFTGAEAPDTPAHLAYGDLADDRNYFIQVLASAEKRRYGLVRFADLMKDSPERHFFQDSLHCRDVRAEYVKRFYPRTKENMTTAAEELKRFLAANPDFSGNQTIVKQTWQALRARLPSAV